MYVSLVPSVAHNVTWIVTKNAWKVEYSFLNIEQYENRMKSTEKQWKKHLDKDFFLLYS